MTVFYLVLGAAFAAGARQVHVYMYPWRNCPRCGGSRRNKSLSAHRDCSRCGSKGRVRRFGAPEERH